MDTAKVGVVTDRHVARHYLKPALASLKQAGLEPVPIVLPPGERTKTLMTVARILDVLARHRFERRSVILALGGGVVGDLAGFAASIYQRGIPYVQVPTTLLAMVDASIGGKTGVDTAAGKNLVGAFHQPAAVLADPQTLETLPAPHLRAGFAEVIKHGVIADEEYFTRVVDDLPRVLPRRTNDDWLECVTSLVLRSIEIKAAVVRRDEREAGVRKTLNFGHTLGHAIEVCSNYAMLHGEAIAAGMVLESALAERGGIAEHGTRDRIRDAVRAAGLPVARPANQRPADLLAATRGDKKSRGGLVEYALPRRIGKMAGDDQGWASPVSDELVLEILQ